MNWNDPQQWLSQIARHRAVVLGMLAGAIVLILITVLKLGGSLPSLVALARSSKADADVVPVSKAEALFNLKQWPHIMAGTNVLNPFHTLYFKPVAPPPPPTNTPPTLTNAPPPPPPPPPPKKIPLLYQGYIENSAGLKQAFLKVGEGLLTLTNGSPVTEGYVLTDFALRTATLQKTNATNVLTFGVPTEIIVPVP